MADSGDAQVPNSPSMEDIAAKLEYKVTHRPDQHDLHDKHILMNPIEAKQEALEKALVRDTLAHALHDRPAQEELKRRNIIAMEKDEIASKIADKITHRPDAHELEEKHILPSAEADAHKQEAVHAFEHFVHDRPPKEELTQRHVVVDPLLQKKEALEHAFVKDTLSHKLADRPTRDQLVHDNIIALDKDDVSSKLDHFLTSQRPSEDDLRTRHVLPGDHDAEGREVARGKLEHFLEDRPDPKTLIDHRVLKADPVRGISGSLQQAASQLEMKQREAALAKAMEGRPDREELHRKHILTEEDD